MIDIPADKIERQYELTCLIPAGFTKSELDEIIKKIESALDKHQAKVDDHQDWGKKELAYTIKREGKAHTEAYYHYWEFTAQPEAIEPIKNEMKLMDEVLRQLLVLAE